MKGVNVVCEPRPGETRDCLDPWKMAFIKADGQVSLCCWSRAVGNIKEQPVNQILHNEASRDMRRGLLTGRMPHDCVICPARGLVPVADLKRKVERYMADDGHQELMKARARAHGLQEEMVKVRRDFDSQRASMLAHAQNLEAERVHLRLHNDQLVERVQSIHEGRASLVRLVATWTRGRARRSALGRWWIGRRSSAR